MSTDPRLEAYLSRMERVLSPFSSSDRAEIITEIKSHVLTALERDPNTQLDSILAALGEPEMVANRYLMERNLKPAKPPVSPIVKWLVIGFLGTVAMLLIFIGVLLTQFSPLFKIDGNQERISILGGAIELSGEDGTIKIGDSTISGRNSTFDGKWPLNKTRKFDLRFGNGRFELKNATDPKNISWECRANENETFTPTQERDDLVVLDFTDFNHVRCTFEIPEKIEIMIDGKNGKISIEEPHYNVDATLKNGKVNLSPDKNQKYQFSLNTINGKTDHFESSPDPKAYRISVNVKNGRITRSSEGE